MADGDPPLHSSRDRPFRDLLKLQGAYLSNVVEMDVDSLSKSLGETEDDVELASDIAVKAGGVQAADKVGTGPQRLLEQLRRAAFGDNAALRERDKLDIDPVAIGVAHSQHGLEVGESNVVVDVDMTARARGAVRN
jgi:hypothetical protein